ncbi:hypothetical protein BT63DRAFT_429428 [Microthyrium microscopicum]|uniref:Uncharacterized protein n=1 Tax=Microthyrium microscopicum TaxID=703497 RepID=A0A6A6TXX4_9PEZI|nr:hypothetical protein BT63DRAFT_429428 [Microthyrium microscopicum]
MLSFSLLTIILAPLVSLSSAQSTPPPSSSTTISSSTAVSVTTTPTTPGNPAATPPDVYLNVPKLHVGRIELDVENLSADINLNANVASLVQINAGVQVSIQKVNITIVDVDAELELIVRLGNLVQIVNRVFSSLDLNPLLITAINNVTSVLGEVVGAVEGLLGSVTQNGNTLNFLVDNLGNIVQQVTDTTGKISSSIVGDYLQNMTYTGASKALTGGLTQKTYSYSPLNALVDIVFNSLGQIVQATVQKATGTTSSVSSSATGAPSSSVSSSSTSSTVSV